MQSDNKAITSAAISWYWIVAGVLGVTWLAIHEWSPWGLTLPLPKCPLHQITGLYCPGCGITRAALSLMHGDLWSALRYNPLAIISIPLLILTVLEQYVKASWIPFKVRSLASSKFFSHIILWVIIGYGVLRNVPIFPFNLLAPYRQ